MAAMADLCERYERWLANHLPKCLESFQPGASEEQIGAYEDRIGCELPEDVRAWYRWRNGQIKDPHSSVLHYEWLSLDASAREWEQWQEYDDLNEDFEECATSRPEDAIVPAYTVPGWIPLAQWYGGTSAYLGIDLDPGPRGTVGQVINFGRDDEDKCVCGASLADFLEFVVDEMEVGRFVVDDDGNADHAFSAEAPGDRRNIVTRLHDAGKFDGRRLWFDESIGG